MIYFSVKEKDTFVITPFKNIEHKLHSNLKQIKGIGDVKAWKENNVGTLHRFQGNEVKIVFLILGADENSKGAASWAVNKPNLFNVAATRAKENFYIIGSRKLYESLNSRTITITLKELYKANIDGNTKEEIEKQSEHNAREAADFERAL